LQSILSWLAKENSQRRKKNCAKLGAKVLPGTQLNQGIGAAIMYLAFSHLGILSVKKVLQLRIERSGLAGIGFYSSGDMIIVL